MKYDAQTAYDKQIAAAYDGDRIGEPVWRIEQDFVAAWCAKLPAGSSVLDVPFGTGRFAPFYRERGLQVHGIDISQAMIDQARSQHGDLVQGWDLRTGDATALPFGDRSIDRAVCFRLVHLLPDPVVAAMLREFARVVREEVLIQAFALAPKAPTLRQRIGRAVKGKLARKPDTPWGHIRNFPHDEPTILGMCRDAGFAVRERHVVGDASNPALAFVLRRA